MTRHRLTIALLVLTITVASAIVVRAVSLGPAPAGRTAADPESIARGAYLVRTMGCNDCHTPHRLGPRGLEPDTSRALTGHPQELVFTLPPPPPEPWMWMGTGTMTAFAGPWGVSFAANLTPDPETGLGKWTEDMFIATMKTRRHQGKGRPLLPPMPAVIVAALTDSDIKDLFAYLQSLPPVKNRVPAPIDPPERSQ
jgi:cytochrome c553